MPKYKLICENCGKEFENYFSTQRFCCRKCFDEYRKINAKLKDYKCEYCGKIYQPRYSEQRFCSVECRGKSEHKRETLVCEYCGKEFERIQSEAHKNNKHFCSVECHFKYIDWCDDDLEILRLNYGKVSSDEMCNLLHNKYSKDRINAKAIKLNLTQDKSWTNEEEKILLENYSTQPNDVLLKLLPNRTKSAILGKARQYNLMSEYYLRRYTDLEEEFLRKNYLTMTNEELASILERTPTAIEQHLNIMNLYRPVEKAKYTSLIRFLRCYLVPWRDAYKKSKNYTCEISGSRSNIVLHHIRGFNLLFNETMEKLDFPDYEDEHEYTNDELDIVLNTFLQVQEKYKQYICITEDIHKDFHSKYGYGNNTKEQWDEYISKYVS